jgi:hypothetical protein
MDLSVLEFVLSGMVLLAAGVSYSWGHHEGIGVGTSATMEIMIETGLVSRFMDDDGDWQFCSAGIMDNICPKCGFKDEEICKDHQ